MTTFKDINEILEFAMEEEQHAVNFYTKLSKFASSDDMRKVFEEFAMEEISHKARLAEIKKQGVLDFEHEKIADLKIADYVIKVKPTPDMTYADALVLAMKKEKAAFKLYTALAQRATSEEVKNLFLALAQEESKHKLRFELEYDEFVLREN